MNSQADEHTVLNIVDGETLCDGNDQFGEPAGDTLIAEVASAHDTVIATADRLLTKRESESDTSPLVLKQRFVLQAMLGHGGMGVVYRAIDLRKREAGDEDAAVAVKVLGGNLEGHPNALTVMQREAKKAQLLAHPNVVTVYDFDRDGDTFFMTMELLDGQPLTAYIAANGGERKARSQQLDIIRQLAEGLVYAHSRGLVHCDLKPDNVFVTERGQVKVLDFGIARAYNDEFYRDQFDVAELGAYTPRYASLGILQGGQHSSPADDVYALGLIACELLGGSHPYNGATAAQVLAGEAQSALPAGLNVWLRRLLSDAITVAEQPLVSDCDRFLRRLKFARRWRRSLTMVLLCVTLLVAVNGYLFWFYQEPEVAFSDLPLRTQHKIEQALGEADVALRFNDINGALIYLDRAYALYPSNDEIEPRIEKVLEQISRYLERHTLPPQQLHAQLDELSAYPVINGSEAYYTFKAALASAQCPHCAETD